MNQLKTWFKDLLNFIVVKPVQVPCATSLTPGQYVEIDEKYYVITQVMMNFPGMSVIWVRRTLRINK